MKTVRIICRSSRLSLLQADIVRKKIEDAVPGMNVEIIGRTSRGDRELCVPLTSLDGTDFFTEEIFDALYQGEADIAVHSLKDMSARHYFSHDAFAIVDRDDTRDVAIFNPDIEQKIKAGKKVIIGTCSPRREEMATVFLRKALPQLSDSIDIKTQSIRGNVESRLAQLHAGKYDGTILATAGLNRLLRSDAGPYIRHLLSGKRLMILPLIECTPAPCQGAIVAEAHPDNFEMVALLKKINNEALHEEVTIEKREALQYGTGSLQQFGVTTFMTSKGQNILYAAGRDATGFTFSKWSGLPEVELEEKNVLSTSDHMGRFFSYAYRESNFNIHDAALYISNHKAVLHEEVIKLVSTKRVWTSGTRTWIELAKRGIWVEGCTDGLGLESLKETIAQPVINLHQNDLHVITHEDAAKYWLKKGWKSTYTYRIAPKENPVLRKAMENADIIFWTSIHQYLQYKHVISDNVLHVSPSGETATLLQLHGINPIIFPTIKSFEQWRKYSTRPLSVA